LEVHLPTTNESFGVGCFKLGGVISVEKQRALKLQRLASMTIVPLNGKELIENDANFRLYHLFLQLIGNVEDIVDSITIVGIFKKKIIGVPESSL
jgi:hypothetical protein